MLFLKSVIFHMQGKWTHMFNTSAYLHQPLKNWVIWVYCIGAYFIIDVPVNKREDVQWNRYCPVSLHRLQKEEWFIIISKLLKCLFTNLQIHYEKGIPF